MFDRFLFALRFFTRVPLGNLGGYEGRLADVAVLFPAIGGLIGLITGLVWFGATLFLPNLPAAGLAIGFCILLTGALHEDGFADCADGLGPAVSREKSLEIMRDSRVGSFGAIALVFSVGLRWAALSTLSPLSGSIALVTAHGYSRAMILMPMAHLNYARKQGLGSLVENGITKQTAWAIAAVTAILCTVIGGWAGLAAILTASALTGLWLTYLNHRLGGYTGDGLGAVQQIVEISILLTFAGIIN